jgi:hypothetical protein
MDKTIDSEKEQEWILKYRAALDAPSQKKSNLKALGATFVKVSKTLTVGIRSVLTKRASTPSPEVSTEATKLILVPTLTMPDQGVQGGQCLAVQSARPENIFRLDAEAPEKAS